MCAGGLWLAGEVLVHHLPRSPLKGQAPGDKLIGHYAKRILIGLGNRIPLPLLGSHIRWSAADGLAITGVGRDKFGHAEIG